VKKFKNFILFFCIAMLFSVVLFSQNTTNKPLDKQINELELGIKYIKLGDTWREAGDLEKAKISYLKDMK